MSQPADRLAEAEERPWEEHGSCRMDCEPDRGRLLLVLGSVSLACGVFSFLVALPALMGLPLGGTTFLMAEQDLRMMVAGQRDPARRRQTERAGERGLHGAGLSLLGSVLWALVLWDWFH